MSNSKKKHLPLILCVILSLVAATIAWVKQPKLDGGADLFAGKVQSHFQQMEADANAIIQDSKMLIELSEGGEDLHKNYKELKIFSKPYTISVLKDDSLVFWNNEMVGNDLQSLDVSDFNGQTGMLTQLSNGSFYVKTDSLPNFGRIYTYFPIKYSYKLNTIYLKDEFSVDRNGGNTWYADIPDDKIDVVSPGVGVPIYDNAGNTVFSLVAVQPVKQPWVSYLLFTLIFIAFISGGIWLTRQAQWISKKYKPWVGCFGLLLIFPLIRWVMLYYQVSNCFDVIPIFETHYPTTYFADTVGDLLFNTILSVWVALFFFKEFRISDPSRFSERMKQYFSFGLYVVIISGIIGITHILRELVMDTDIPFDFDKIGNLKWSSLLSIIGVLMLMLTLFLFSFRVSLEVRRIGLSQTDRLSSLGLAVVITFLGAFLSGLDPSTLILLLLFSIIYIIAFDLYVENDPGNLMWVVGWLVIYSAFTSSFLYKYHQLKEWDKRAHYAEILTNERDENMEQDLQQLYVEILKDKEFRALMTKEVSEDAVEQMLIRNHGIDLKFVHYRYKSHLFVEDTLGRLNTVNPNDKQLLREFDEGIIIKDNLKLVRDEDALESYLLKIKYPRPRWMGDAVIILEFNRDIGGNPRISTEIFISDDYLDLEGLSEYEYAVYKDSRVVFQSKNIKTSELLFDEEKLPLAGKYRFEKTNGYSSLIYHAWNGNVAVMKMELPDFVNKIKSLNSYLFTIMVIVLGILMIVNTILQISPIGPRVLFSPLPSLKNRIQVSVIAIIILSFIVIGVVTIIFFEQKNVTYHEGRLGRKAKSIRRDTAREIEEKQINSLSVNKFKDIVNPVSSIHRMDINIYDINGHLIESSGRDIYSKGLMSPLMNAAALYELRTQDKEKVTMDQDDSERIGKLIYDAQYEVLRDQAGNKIAYIGMPYYSQTSSLQNETSDFISTLLNVYVFLLVIAGSIAIFVANSITRPISQIGEKLKGVKVGKKNEPLMWKSKDELGALINEYNKMIQKLEDSAVLLAQSERESAWREMAKQVAHEIKNPLTPMKLSIQYLQHAYRSNPDNMESMLKRVSNTLIEQIDNLSHIATEFSNFAKMPRAENEYFKINNLVESVYNLFSEQEDIDMAVTLPNEQISVFADKNQLMRVLNNLIKNAMQAIPEDRRGSVEVLLRRIEGDMVQLEVKDNGCGIPDDMKEFIFVPHITTKSSGTGLGLAMTKSIVEALDGNIYFETVENVGTSFFVELPISEGEK